MSCLRLGVVWLSCLRIGVAYSSCLRLNVVCSSSLRLGVVCSSCLFDPVGWSPSPHHLVGLVVKASASRAEDPGSKSACADRQTLRVEGAKRGGGGGECTQARARAHVMTFRPASHFVVYFCHEAHALAIVFKTECRLKEKVKQVLSTFINNEKALCYSRICGTISNEQCKGIFVSVICVKSASVSLLIHLSALIPN